MGCPIQGYWSGLSFPSPGNLPNPGIKPASSALAGGFLIAEPPGKPCNGEQVSKIKQDTASIKIVWLRGYKTISVFNAAQLLNGF